MTFSNRNDVVSLQAEKERAQSTQSHYPELSVFCSCQELLHFMHDFIESQNNGIINISKDL